MKTLFPSLFKLLYVTMLVTCPFISSELQAQSAEPMWQLQSTYNIGSRVTAVEFLHSTDDPLIAIGTQNESNGGIEIRNVLTGKVVKGINPNGAVFAISGSMIIPYIAVGTIYGASIYGLQNNKRIILQTIGRGRITTIKWLDGATVNSTQIIAGDQDGNISFFKLDTNATTITAYKTIPYQINPSQPSMQNGNPMVSSFSYWNNKFTAGYINQIVSWDTTGWVRTFQANEPPGQNGRARAMIVADVASNADFLLTADRDSIQGYNYDGSQRFRVPFFAGDSPIEIAFGAETFPFVAISTTEDRCLLYKIESNTATFLGNFSNHSFAVSSVDIGSFGGDNYFMATGSGDKTVEIWKYNPQYKP
jgi:WD40 repeat protein